MTNVDASDLIVIAIKLDDPALADQLITLLSEVPGIRLTRAEEAADVTLVSSRTLDTLADEGAALTPRELEVLYLIAEGASNKTIARRLNISVHTAKFHVGSLLDKLEATGRTDAITHAVRLGVIQL